jgi:hypothetical protein
VRVDAHPVRQCEVGAAGHHDLGAGLTVDPPQRGAQAGRHPAVRSRTLPEGLDHLNPADHAAAYGQQGNQTLSAGLEVDGGAPDPQLEFGEQLNSYCQ